MPTLVFRSPARARRRRRRCSSTAPRPSRCAAPESPKNSRRWSRITSSAALARAGWRRNSRKPMYEPPLHRQEDLAAEHELIRKYPLGLLISHGPSGLLANAIPFLIDAEASRFGTLLAHVARANP